MGLVGSWEALSLSSRDCTRLQVTQTLYRGSTKWGWDVCFSQSKTVGDHHPGAGPVAPQPYKAPVRAASPFSSATLGENFHPLCHSCRPEATPV